MNIDTLNPEHIIAEMAAALHSLLDDRGIDDPVMVGIYTGGAWVAQRLHRLLELNSPLGTLDISFYRDDFTRVGMNPQVRPSQLPANLENRHIILVDDVLNTGRTIRAALNELFDYGRPASILLAVLIERGGRELPVQADVVGAHVGIAPDQHIKLHGPDPLRLSLVESARQKG